MIRAGLLGFALLQAGLMDTPAKPKGYVIYGAESQAVKAGVKSTVELHFRVLEGFHVNSHTPRSEMLIPTTLRLNATEGVKLGETAYPKGQEYSFSFNPGEKLEVYSGPFTIAVPMVASSGEHTVDGTLRYQACDHAACYPPKTLPVQVVLLAK